MEGIDLRNTKDYPLKVGLNVWVKMGGNASAESVPNNLMLTGSLIAILPLIVAFLFLQKYWQSGLAAGVVCSKRLLNQAVGKSLRTHNLKPKKGAQAMRKNEKITALYERLRRDDFGKDDDR